MRRRLVSRSASSGSSRWEVWAAVVSAGVAVIGLLVALGVLKPFDRSGGEDHVSAGVGPSIVTGNGTVAGIPGAPGCYQQIFASVASDRIRSLENGAFEVTLLSQGQPLTGPAGLLFTTAGRHLGALRFSYYPDGDVYVFEEIVDGDCRTVSDVYNETRPDLPKNRVNGNNYVRIRFPGGLYRLWLQTDAGAFKLRFSGAT